MLDVPAVRARAGTVLRKQARWREFGHSVPTTVEVHEVAQDVLLLADEVDRLTVELDIARAGLWKCFEAAGADTDGDDRFRCPTGQAAVSALNAVTILARDYSDALDEIKP